MLKTFFLPIEHQCLSEEIYLVLNKLNHAKPRSIREDVFKALLLHNGNYFEELAVCSWGVSKLSLQALVTLGSSKYSISLEAHLTHSIGINITCLALTAFTTCFINLFCFPFQRLSSFFCCKYFVCYFCLRQFDSYYLKTLQVFFSSFQRII